MNQLYLDTARLLAQVAPLVIADGTFALEALTSGLDVYKIIYKVKR